MNKQSFHSMDHSIKRVGSFFLFQSLGQGNFGEVFYAKQEGSDLEFAVKCLDKSLIDNNQDYKEALIQEVKILHLVDHPNIVRWHYCHRTKNYYYIIMEYCNQGNLQNYLSNLGGVLLPETQVVTFMFQIKEAFKKLRELKIVHCDFKLENIFMHNGQLKIGDFGASLLRKTDVDRPSGSPFIMAPEISYPEFFDGRRTKTDLWSIGCVFYFLLFGKPAFPIESLKVLSDAIRNPDFEIVIWKPISETSHDLLIRLLRKYPNQRIDWPDFFAHPMFD